MKQLGISHLSVLLIGTLLLCHGVFGALHLICYPPQCVGDSEHTAEHQTVVSAVGDTHEYPADHGTSHGASTGYFAVLAFSLLALLMGSSLEHSPLRITPDARWPSVLRRVPAVLRPPPTPTPLTLQVFKL